MTSAKFTQCVVPGEAGTLAPASLTEATAEMMMCKDAVICSWCTAKLITVDTAGSPGPTDLILLCYTPHAKRQYGNHGGSLRYCYCCEFPAGLVLGRDIKHI